MCLIAWSWQPASSTPLIVIGNRDEFSARPTQALHWWGDAPILAGRDLQAGGTWLGVDRRSRLAALTNYRDPAHFRSNAPSRGRLVTDFLLGSATATDYLQQLRFDAGQFNPFNLLVFDGQCLLGYESRSDKLLVLQPGIGAVSNADFDTPWPKLRALKAGFSALDRDSCSDAQLLALLANRSVAPDADLPQTGIPIERERSLSCAFISMEGYGTRASSIVRLHAAGSLSFLEQSFDASGPASVVTLTR